MNNKQISYIIRAIIAFLFLLSAVAKLYPSPYFAISTFEFSQLYSMGFSEIKAAYFSRILIGIEFALGVLMLQNHYLKKLIIPATLLMLAVFTIHLCYVTFLTGGNTGNCGCFGSLLPMTPIEAIIKNVVAIGLLIYLYKIIPNSDIKNNIWILISAVLGFILMLFMLAPIDHQTNSNYTVSPVNEVSIDSASVAISTPIEIEKPSKEIIVEAIKPTEKPKEIVVAKSKSGYAHFYPNIDSGRQILGFFVPGCEHCRETVKELTEMRNSDANFPKLQILFMDEEANLIPDFFAFVGAEYPYKVIGIIDFWKLLGAGKQVPGVKYIKDGKEIKYYFGTAGSDKFNGTEFKKLIQ